MVDRFLKIREYIVQLDIEAVDLNMPNMREVRQIEKLCNKLQQLDEVTKLLQKDDTSLADVRCLFDTILEDFPEMECRLGTTAAIIYQPEFETAIIKVMNGN